ncbi:MAG TPA: penicillin acylase family protein, partial [Myxococcota bacterium]|nr:penicillin acylase family protein [Myxococcota bacterium]
MKFPHECLDFSKKLATGLLSDLVKGGIRLLDRTRQPVLDGTFKTTGLDGPVEIIRDRFAVPHIYASSVRDAFFAQGFVHAQDRMCQMELNRRFGHGRLSEIFGAAALPLDKAARVLGFRQTALIDLENS